MSKISIETTRDWRVEDKSIFAHSGGIRCRHICDSFSDVTENMAYDASRTAVLYSKERNDMFANQ